MAQPLLLLTPRLKALRCLFPSSSPAVPAGATEWWADVTHGEMLQLSYTDSKTLCPISWPATFQWILLRKPECKFCFSDLFWPNQNMNKSLEFFLPCLRFLPLCLPHCVFFNAYFFARYNFQALHTSPPLFSVLCIILHLFIRNKSHKLQPEEVRRKKLWGAKSM